VNFRVKNWHRLAEGTHNFTAGVSLPKSNTLYTALETTFAAGALLLLLNYTTANCTSKAVPELQSTVKYW
jgi:hypothetical protein